MISTTPEAPLSPGGYVQPAFRQLHNLLDPRGGPDGNRLGRVAHLLPLLDEEHPEGNLLP